MKQIQYKIGKKHECYSKNDKWKDVLPVACGCIPHTFLANGSVNLLASSLTLEVKKKFWSAQLEGDASWLISATSSPFVATPTTYIWMFCACAWAEAWIASADPFDVTRIPECRKHNKHLKNLLTKQLPPIPNKQAKFRRESTMTVLGDDEADCWLVRFTLTKMLKFCLNYSIGQLSSFPLPPYPHQAQSIWIHINEITMIKLNQRNWVRRG